MAPRRFPPPWSVEDIDAAFIVKDSPGRSSGESALRCFVMILQRDHQTLHRP
jgi:hypothetical protein